VSPFAPSRPCNALTPPLGVRRLQAKIEQPQLDIQRVGGQVIRAAIHLITTE